MGPLVYGRMCEDVLCQNLNQCDPLIRSCAPDCAGTRVGTNHFLTPNACRALRGLVSQPILHRLATSGCIRIPECRVMCIMRPKHLNCSSSHKYGSITGRSFQGGLALDCSVVVQISQVSV